MKKIMALICAFALAVSLTACAKGVGQTGSSEESMPIPSQGEAALESALSSKQGGSSSGGASGGGASSSEPAVSAAAKVRSAKAEANLNAGSYQVKTAKYSYNKDNLDYSASYPQLNGKLSTLETVNKALDTCAMQTIRSMGTAKKEQRTSVRVSGDIAYEGKNFISVGFNEYTKLSPKAASTHVMRTVNIDLKTGKAVGFSDMVVSSDAFYQTLEKAAKSQLSAEQSAVLTAAAIKSGLNSNIIYFTDSGVGFCVQISKPEQKIVRITLDYTAAKPFMTKNANWSNFI